MTLEFLEIKVSFNSKGEVCFDPHNFRPYKYGIYLFYYRNKIIRVGETASGFSRIRKGFTQKLKLKRNGRKKKNYYAYPWRLYYRNKKIKVVYFSLKQLGEQAKKPEIRRAIEAEITYQIRLKTKKWPLRMTEIHFSEELRKKKKIINVVTEIMKYILRIKRSIRRRSAVF